MAKKKDDSPLYVGIEDPIMLRRQLLEATRDILQYLKRYEEFKKVREKKLEIISEIRAVSNEIGKLIWRVKRLLPKTGVRLPKKKIEIEEAKLLEGARPRVKKKAKIPKPELSAIEKIESELSAIEEKLARL
ncbi:hypothetical protein DRZ77_01110 [Candidatus Woesearchaeota archaeon]|nr:hypothetical protein [Candidatus Woesearchaeota archaeon]RLE40819.1 MAG: hypothetical protein DRZ77_01110 [Candidatus Woesearchaeota archaeon]